MITVVTYKWSDPESDRNPYYEYSWKDVEILISMLDRHLGVDYKLVVFTNELVQGINYLGETESVVLTLNMRQWPPNTRYPKLSVFDQRNHFEGLVMSIDLGTVITGDLSHLVARYSGSRFNHITGADPLHPKSRFNSAFMLFWPDQQYDIYASYNGYSPRIVQNSGIKGTDQAWIWLMRGSEGTRFVGRPHGVLFHSEWDDDPKLWEKRVVIFNGRIHPDTDHARRLYPWLEEHYR